MTPVVLIVGSADDLHAEAVAGAVRRRGGDVVMVDAATLAEQRWRSRDDCFEVYEHGRWLRPQRGWLRRLAPPGANEGTELGGLKAAELSARLVLLTGLSPALVWLTNYWMLARGENKLVQYAHARRLGLPVPATCLACQGTDLELVGETEMVVKPLGVGSYQRDGIAYAVHARVVDLDDPALAALPSAPFIAQRRIVAREHLRVVTVLGQAWTSSLDATQLPVDWREHEPAHTSWAATSQPHVEQLAVALARSLDLGYTSQDWIVDESDTAWFVDGNPAGQWLFLPEPVGAAVTERIAEWLVSNGERP